MAATIESGATERLSATHRAFWRRVLDALFGFDFFVSYCWEDGGAYALALAQRLEAQGYEVFLDRRKYGAGDDWAEVGGRTLRKTGQLILVGTAKALTSDPVRREVEVFSATGRRILPISIGGSLDWKSIEGPLVPFLPPTMLRIVEAADALARGPSEETVAAVRRTFDLVMQNRKRVRALAGVAIALLALTLAATWFGYAATLSAQEALDQRDVARAQLLATQARRAVAEAGGPDQIELAGALSLESMEVSRNRGRPSETEAVEAARHALARLPLRTIQVGQGVQVRALAHLGDGQLAIGGSDGRIRLPATSCGRDVVVAAHQGADIHLITGGVRKLVGLPDGRLASGGGDGVVKLWPRCGGSPETFRHEASITALALLTDNRVVSAGSDGLVKIWQGGRDNKPIVSPHAQGGPASQVLSLAPLSDGGFASGGLDGRIVVWRADGSFEKGLPKGAAGIYALTRLDADHLLSGDAEGRVKLWSVQKGLELQSFNHGGFVRALVVLGDGRFASAGDDGQVAIWQVERPGAPLARYLQGSAVYDLALMQDGSVAAGDSAGKVKVWLADEPRGQRTTLVNGAPVRALAALPDGRLASGGEDGSVRLWQKDLRGRAVVLDPGLPAPEIGLSGQPSAIRALAVLDDGRIAGGSADGMVRIWHGDGAGRPELHRAGPEVWALAAMKDARLAIGGWGAQIQLWPHGPSIPNGSPVWALAAFQDGRLLSGDWSSKMKVWGPDLTEPTRVLNHGLATRSLPVRANGRPFTAGSIRSVLPLRDGRLASAGDDGLIKIWPAAGNAEPTPLVHGNVLCCLAELPEGGLVSAGDDGRIKLWPLAGRAEPVVVEHGAAIQALAIVPGGIASGGTDSTIKVWDTSEAELIATLCQRAGRNLSREEWYRYIGTNTLWRPSCRTRPSAWLSPDQ